MDTKKKDKKRKDEIVIERKLFIGANNPNNRAAREAAGMLTPADLRSKTEDSNKKPKTKPSRKSVWTL